MQDITSQLSRNIVVRNKPFSLHLKRGLTIGVISLGAILITLSPSNYVSAEGAGSPVECENPDANLTGNDNILSFTAPGENIIDGVCIKSGDNMFSPDKHSALLGNGTYENGCYSVTGVGTPSVTVERIGTLSDTCQELSHVDVFYSVPTPTPTPTASPTPTPTATPTASPTPTPSATPTTTPTLTTASPTPTPTATPTSTPGSIVSNTSSSVENTGAVLGATASNPTPLPGAVLGASAQLPETGAETTWFLIGIFSLLSGSGLISLGIKKD